MLGKIGCLFSIVMFCNIAAASPRILENISYYSVQGLTELALRQSLFTESAKRRTGSQGYAYTSWKVTWRFHHKQKQSQCLLYDISTVALIHFSYPKWIDRNNASPALQRKWLSYSAALQRHEQGHKDFAVRAANSISYALSTMGAAPNCNVLTLRANAKAQKIFDDYKQREVNYDRHTKHGQVQGAVF